MNSSPFVALLAIPREVIWSYSVGGLVLAIGLIALVLRGDLRRTRGLDRVILLGPLSYAAPLAAFGTEHFTITRNIASIVPSWIPWHLFWAYLVGACFIAAAFSMVTGVLARLSASLVAFTFFSFVALMDAPAWARSPGNRFALALALRELSFSGGALALAASLGDASRERRATILAAIARYFIAVPVLIYGIEQFLHGQYVPGIPLKLITPRYVYGHAVWSYLAAIVYTIAGTLLLSGRSARTAATWLGMAVLVLVAIVYVPIALVEHTSLVGLNFVADTLMYGGAVLLLARAMPRKA